MAPDVVVNSVIKRFESELGGHVHALQELSLRVDRGEFCVLVGDSGSGKTTLLRCIAGLESPDEGVIELRGKTVFSADKRIFVPPQERSVGMVFQSYAIWPHLTVYQNVALPLIKGRYRLAKNAVRERVREALNIAGLSGLEERPAPNLSGGQQQRVALARALAVSSSMLLMDEPLSNLDARLREEVRSQIRTIAKTFETTVIYVTHDQVEALALADRIALMRNGCILQQGTPEDLYDRSMTLEVAEFFGPINLLEGEVLAKGLVKTEVEVLTVSFDSVKKKSVMIGFRPEQVVLAATRESGPNRFEGRIVSRVFLGGRNIYEVQCKNRLFRVEVGASFGLNQTVQLYVPPDSLRVFETNDS